VTDAFMDRVYRRNVYDCFHFVREVWAHLTGEDINTRLSGLMDAAQRRIVPTHVRKVKRLDVPVTPCFILMRKPCGEMHIGIYWHGRIFHLQPYGPALQPVSVATYGFPSYEYFQ
jgi:hypothetical protein